MLESSIVSEASGIGAGKVLDKKGHFKAGVIDFTAGSLGKLNDKISQFRFVSCKICFRWSGIGLCKSTIGYGQS